MSFRTSRAARELAIFAGAYLTYFGVRAITQGDLARALDNASGIIDFERWAGIAVEGQVQDAFLSSSALVDIANAVYMYGHWPVIIASGIVLFRFRPEHYYRMRNVILLAGAVGLVIFALFPVAPPRLTDLPLVDTVTREASGYRQLMPPSLVNEYAAMPSFHAGWNLLIGIVVFQAFRQWWMRGFAVASAGGMLIAVVATANHYLVDVAAGVGIVLLSMLVLRTLEHRRERPTISLHDVRGRPSGGQRRAATPGRHGVESATGRS